MAHILWVEDQSHWINKLNHTLETADLDGAGKPNTVEVYRFAEAACQHIFLAKQAPDIALLDAHMNGNEEAGFNVSRALIKKWPHLPIIYLSEHSGTDIEQHAFERAETQDFIAKHQSNIESILCWRMKATLRQTKLRQSNLNDADLIVSGELTIDCQSWNLYWKNQRLMNPKNPKRPLAPTPRKILRILVEHSPRPITTLQMSDYLGLDFFSYATYRQHIRTLRQSIAENGDAEFIEHCRQGQGIVTFGDEGAYCWVP